MAPDLLDQLERRMGETLDRIPGYRGYRLNEDRRDADRRVRDHVVARYSALADRVERVARDLSEARRIAEVGPVDQLAQTLRHFVDRVRTATYGYGGLFGDRDVDATALDQLRLFDESLLDGEAELEKPVSDLEAAFTANGDLGAPARAGTAVVRNLLARFDLRNEVVETGKPVPQQRMLAALRPAPPPPARVFDLRQGDALSVLGDDFVADATIEVDGRAASFRLFRLRQQPEEWLFVPASGVDWLARLHRAEESTAGQPGTAGVTMREVASGSGNGAVTGTASGSQSGPVRFKLLAGEGESADRGVELDWGAERLVLVGTDVHPNDVEIYGKPGAAG